MQELNALIREYCEILNQERLLSERKEALRAAIAAEMERQQLEQTRTPDGSAKHIKRYKLLPRREAVLNLLGSADLFPFARFTPAGVKEILVPKFGREALIPLFEIQTSRYLMVSRFTRKS
jgi:hypothetical protein